MTPEPVTASAPVNNDEAASETPAPVDFVAGEVGAFDEVPGVNSTVYLAAGGVFLVMALITFAMTLFAHFDDEAWKQFDLFHPKGVAIRSRHFDKYDQQFWPSQELQYNGETVNIEAQRSACVAKWMRIPSIHWTQANYFETNDPAVECKFYVPHTAVWGAMTSSLIGFAAVAFYARDVLSKARGTAKMSSLATTIHDAAMEFLHQEYSWLVPYVFALWVFLFVAIDGQENDWTPSASVSFLIGAALSAACGYFGMSIATEGNCRTAAACFSSEDDGLSRGLQVAFRTGACMGLAVVSAGAFGLSLCYLLFNNVESLAGFGFGSSAVALFARVGGGIYTKAADVGADLCGKVDAGLAEDSPKNPATIADCVGDNVGDVAGMGADLFESFVGAVVASAVLGAPEFGEKGVALPFYIMMIGILVSVLCTTYIKVSAKNGGVPGLEDLLKAMHNNVLAAGAIITVSTLFLCVFMFKEEADYLEDLGNLNEAERLGLGYPALNGLTVGDSSSLSNVKFTSKNPGPRIFGCILLGLVVGILIGLVTEYFTSHTDQPTQSIAEAAQFGPGPVIIQGLGMGMYSTVAPLLLICAAVLGSFYFAGFYGVAISCVGMLSTLGVTMSTDAYGPVSDNAGGIAEMSELPPWVRDYTDSLDALGNTTAATGKGFANGSAVLSAISTLTAFARSAEIEKVDLMKPVVVIGVLVGALLPYLFAAMTMLSVNKAAQEMMGEVRRQFLADPRILDDDGPAPDYNRCIMISCKSSLREMLLPGVLATFAPLIMGFTFGSHCLVGLLIGAIASGYLLGVMMSNTGGAWDNAKKYVEAGELVIDGQVQGKKTDCHKAAVCGDTVGDPFKDTSGPALNILIKLMTRFAFVLAPLFDDAWKHFWVGLILAAGAAIIVLIIHFLVLVPADAAKEAEQAVADAPVAAINEPVQEGQDVVV